MLFSFLSLVIFNLIQHPLAHFSNTFHGLEKPKLVAQSHSVRGSHGYQAPWRKLSACLFLQKSHFSLRKTALKGNIFAHFILN